MDDEGIEDKARANILNPTGSNLREWTKAGLQLPYIGDASAPHSVEERT